MELKDRESQSYQYHPTGGDEIRVLQLLPGKPSDPLRCRLRNVRLGDSPEYMALSYAWGDLKKPSVLLCEGWPIEITANLKSFLLSYRSETVERQLWADAVCINQKDNVEKTKQVRMMGEIYAKAKHVNIWLGEESDDTKDSFKTLEYLHSYFEQQESYNDPNRYRKMPEKASGDWIDLLKDREVWMPSFFAVMERPWFRRCWVLQELARSAAASILCGQKVLPWVVVADVVWGVMHSGILSMAYSGARDDEYPEVAIALAGLQSVLIMELIRRDFLRGKKAPLLETVISCRLFKCSDKRDVVYSILGMAGDIDSGALTVDPDYSLPVEEVYRRFVINSIFQKGHLLTFSTPSKCSIAGALDLPSWVPDFSHMELANPLMHMRDESGLPFQASKKTRPVVSLSNDGKILRVLGKRVDAVVDIATSHGEIEVPAGRQRDEAGKPIDQDKLTYLKTQICLDTWTEFVFGKYQPVDVAAPLFDSFWRTILCNLTSSGERPKPEYARLFKQWLDFAHDLTVLQRAEDPKAYLNEILQVESAFGLRNVGWRFCKTRDGRLGRVLLSVQLGDEICIMYGGELAYAIRPYGDGLYKFVSPCYIHGLMDGEGLEIAGLVDEEFNFC